MTSESLKSLKEKFTFFHDKFANPVMSVTWNCPINKMHVQRMMRTDKEKYINEQCEHIENNSITNSIQDLYQGVKNLTNKFKPTIDIIKDENGKIFGEAEEVKERWVHYSTDLYKKNPNIVVSQLTFVVNDKEELPPLRSEVAKAINELKANKMSGSDDITAELVKCGDKNVVNYFLTLFMLIWVKKNGQMTGLNLYLYQF